MGTTEMYEMDEEKWDKIERDMEILSLDQDRVKRMQTDMDAEIDEMDEVELGKVDIEMIRRQRIKIAARSDENYQKLNSIMQNIMAMHDKEKPPYGYDMDESGTENYILGRIEERDRRERLKRAKNDG